MNMTIKFYTPLSGIIDILPSIVYFFGGTRGFHIGWLGFAIEITFKTLNK